MNPAINSNSRTSIGDSPWWFFALTLGWSWLFWIPTVILRLNVTQFPGALLMALGGIGPMLAAILLTYLTQDKAGQRDYWRRVIDFRRINPGWYAVILLLPPVYCVLAVLTGMLGGESWPTWETTLGYLSQPLSIVPFAFFMFFFGPLPEELGWRGYALDRLQAKWSALTASLILGVVWSVWHLPMFFMAGGLIGTVFPPGSLVFYLAYGPGLLAESVLFTWVFNNTRRSILSAVLLHFMINFTGEFLDIPGPFKVFQFVWIIAMAVIVIIFWGPKTLTRAAPKEPTQMDSGTKQPLAGSRGPLL